MNEQNHTIEPEELMVFLDGELSPERAVTTSAHLAQCKECQTRAAEFAEISRGLLEWEIEAGNLSISGVITQALDEREQKTRQSEANVSTRNQPIWTWLKNPKTFPRNAWQFAGVGVAVVVVVLLIGTSMLRRVGTFYRPLTDEKARSSEQVSAYLVPPTTAESPVSRARVKDGLMPVPPPPPPPAGAIPGPEAGSLEAIDQISEKEPASEDAVAQGPMIVRSAQLTVTIKEFELARKSVDDILKLYHGYIGDLTVNTPNGAARSINAKLRIPSAQLDSAMSALKSLGRVEAEAQNGEEVTQQYVDLNARLSNARKTQQRLIEIQRDRTGKLSDVLSVELQISRVQGEIEQMEAQLKTMKTQVSFASLDLTITEQYKAELKVVPPSLGDQLRNAGIDGIRSIRDAVVSVLFWLLSTGPILLLWILILFYPSRIVWKKLRPRFIPAPSQ